MEIKRSTTVNAPAAKIWNILGPNYSNIGDWTSQVLESHGAEIPEVGEARVCETNGFGKSLETLVEYDEAQRKFEFLFESEKLPFFVREMKSQWSVFPQDENTSIVQVRSRVSLMPVFKQIMSGMMRNRFEKLLDSILEEMKYYAENDEIHPRKARQVRNLAAAAA